MVVLMVGQWESCWVETKVVRKDRKSVALLAVCLAF